MRRNCGKWVISFTNFVRELPIADTAICGNYCKFLLGLYFSFIIMFKNRYNCQLPFETWAKINFINEGIATSLHYFLVCMYLCNILNKNFTKYVILSVTTMFQIVDTTYEVSPGTVEIVGGGVNQRYVEVRLTSQIGKSMDYVIQAYSKGSN